MGFSKINYETTSFEIQGVLSKFNSQLHDLNRFWFYNLIPLKIRTIIINDQPYVFVFLPESLDVQRVPHRDVSFMQIPIMAIIQWHGADLDYLNVVHFLGLTRKTYWVIGKYSDIKSLTPSKNIKNNRVFCFTTALTNKNIETYFSHEIDNDNCNSNHYILNAFNYIDGIKSVLDEKEIAIFLKSDYDDYITHNATNKYGSYNALFEPIVKNWFHNITNLYKENYNMKLINYITDLYFHYLFHIPLIETYKLIKEKLTDNYLDKYDVHTIIFNNHKEY